MVEIPRRLWKLYDAGSGEFIPGGKLVEGSSYYGTKDFEDSDDEQWKAFITELHDMLNG